MSSIQHFAANLSHLRLRSGLKQSDLADAVGVKRETISHYERGRQPDLVVVTRISDVLKVRIDQLLHEDLTTSNMLNEPNVGYSKKFFKRTVPIFEVPLNLRETDYFLNQCDQIEEFNFPANAACPELGFIATGDAMSPTINAGDVIFLVTVAKKEVQDGKVFFVKLDGSRPFSARIFRNGTGFELRFDRAGMTPVKATAGAISEIFEVVSVLRKSI